MLERLEIPNGYRSRITIYKSRRSLKHLLHNFDSSPNFKHFKTFQTIGTINNINNTTRSEIISLFQNIPLKIKDPILPATQKLTSQKKEISNEQQRFEQNIEIPRSKSSRPMINTLSISRNIVLPAANFSLNRVQHPPTANQPGFSVYALNHPAVSNAVPIVTSGGGWNTSCGATLHLILIN